MQFPPFEHARLLNAAWREGAPEHNLGASGYVAPPWPDRDLPDLDHIPAHSVNLHAETELQAHLAGLHGLAPTQVRVTAGTTAANTSTLLAMLGPGDHVVCERPFYQPLPGLAQALGASVTYVDRDPEADWRLMPDQVEDALRDDTRLVMLTSPNNPTGAAASEADLRRIGDACAEHGAHLLVDQVYAELTDHPLAACVHDHAITTSGLNKRWGAPGLRVGWALAPPALADPIGTAHQYAFLGASLPGETAALVLMQHEKRMRHHMEVRLETTRPIYRAWADEHGLPPPIPGSLTAFPPWPGADLAWAKRMRRAGVLTLPGEAFGTPGHIRIGLGLPPAELEAALAALAAIKD